MYQPRKLPDESALRDDSWAGRLKFVMYRLPALPSRETQPSPRATFGTSKILELM